MRYAQIRAFHHVALHGGFSRAAAALHVSQPSISEQVRQLEQAHDVLLFQRAGRQVRLTPAGEDLFLLTKRFFEAEEQIERQLTASRAAVTGTLRIVADSALHVTEALGRFRAQYPDVFIQLRSGNSETVLAALRSYDAEIGVLGSHAQVADMDSVDLGETPILAIAQKGALPDQVTSLSLQDLARHPLIFREKGSRTRAGIESCARTAGLRLSPVIEVEGREAMREVVASGAGIGFISQAETGRDPRLRAVPIDGIDLGMTETVIHLAMRRDVPVIRSFMRILHGLT